LPAASPAPPARPAQADGPRGQPGRDGRLQTRPAGQVPSMTVLRAAARPMLAGGFVVPGFDTTLPPPRGAPPGGPVVQPLAELVPGMRGSTEDAVRLNGAVQFTAGSMLALGVLPRLSALAIAATLVPTTVAGHRFWEIEDDKERAQQRIHFLKNLA